VSRQHFLLSLATVILKRQNERVLRCIESVRFDAIHQNISEQDLGRQGVAMVNEGLTIWAIPAIHCKKNVIHDYIHSKQH
jgi:hypothetical protein